MKIKEKNWENEEKSGKLWAAFLDEREIRSLRVAILVRVYTREVTLRT